MSKRSSLKILNDFTPFGGERHGFFLLHMEQHHDGLSHAFHLTVLGTNKPLLERETAMADAHDGGLNIDQFLSGEDLVHEIGLKVHGDDGALIDKVGTYLAKVIHLRRVIVLEVHSVVYMTKRIGIHPSELDGHDMMIFNFRIAHTFDLIKTTQRYDISPRYRYF